MGLAVIRLVLLLVIASALLPVVAAKKSKRWTYPRPQWSVPSHRMNPEPCRLFLWDAASAARFCECTRLLKTTASNSVWEDCHKQRWLRIPFASPLLRLFPCQQHSLSRCAKCGHDYSSHVRWAAEKRKDRAFDKLLHKSALEGTKNAPVDYRRVAMFFKEAVYKRDGGKGKPRDTDDSNGSSSSGGEDALPRTGRIDWGKLLAAVSESQRTTMLTMSGINLTSVDAREAYAKVCEAERLKAEQKDKDRGGSGSGRTKTGRRGKGSSRRRGRGVGIDRSRDGRRIGSGGAGGGETDSEVAERNLRAFRTIKYV